MARGDRVVLLLFLLLTVFSLFLFWSGGRAAELPFSAFTMPIVVLAVAASMLIGIFVTMDAWRRGRSGWWIYLVAAIIPLVNLAVGLRWAKAREQVPRRWGRWTL